MHACHAPDGSRGVGSGQRGGGGCLVNHQHTWHTMNRPKVVQGTIKKKDNKTNRTTQTIDDNQKDEKEQKDENEPKFPKRYSYAGNRCRKTAE